MKAQSTMATYSQTELTQLVKEVLLYRQVAEYLKTYKQVASEATKRYVIASGFGQGKEDFKIVVYMVKEMKLKEADELVVYIREKYNSIIGTAEQIVDYKWFKDRTVSGLLWCYTFWRSKNGKGDALIDTSKLYFH